MNLPSTQSIGRGAARHPWLTLLLWVVVLGASFVSAGGLSQVLVDSTDPSGSSESVRAIRLIKERLRTDTAPEEFIIVEAADGGSAADVAAAVTALEPQLRALDVVTSVVSYQDAPAGSEAAASLLADDGRMALVQVTLTGTPNEASTNVLPVIDAVTAADAAPGVRVTTAGQGSVNYEFNELATATLEHGELIGVGVALVILLFVFGAAMAAGLPLILAIAAIFVAMGLTAIVGRAFALSTFVTNIITMIGLAVGIDYSLFVVQRFREERDRGLERIEAVARAAGTASRAVLFSGFAVVIALSGLLLLPDPMFKAFGIGAILVVIAAVAAALTLLPAMLGLLGDRVNWLTLPLIGRRRSPDSGRGFWGAMTRFVTARPIISVVAAVALLGSLGAVYATVDLGTSGIETLPKTSNVLHAYETLTANFGSDLMTSEIVIDAPDVQSPAIQSAIARLESLLAADPAYGSVTVETNPAGDLALLTVAEKSEYSSSAAREALSRLRHDMIPQAFDGTGARVLVTGASASVVDAVAETVHYMPLVFGFVLGFSFLLLMLVFRSVVVPLKAVVMNLLSVAAAYGMIVLVFQHGVGADLFGFRQVPVIESWLPLFLFSILFGLSMDYHVFLLSRIKERYDETRDNSHAVEFGLRSTGSIITGAALIMVAVFGGFAIGDLAMFQQMGFGLAVAVILDATVVRSVLVPASMELLGDWNWYFPRWLEWLPQINIEGQPRTVETAAHVAAAPAFASIQVPRNADAFEVEYAMVDGGN